MSPLPPHARLIADDAVWMEGAALQQLAHVAGMPGCCCAVGMPDLHPGRGIPIGAAFAFDGVVRPALVGGDAGCGVRWTVVPRPRFTGDALVRRVDEATQGPVLPDVDPEALVEAAWTQGPAGLAGLAGVPEGLADWAATLPPDGLPASGPRVAAPQAAGQLGTVGGGNHFVEVSRVDAVHDAAAARALGLTPGGLVVVAHSGSRGVGGALAEAWGGEVLVEADAQQRYLAQLAGACRYAQTNRALVTWRLLTALGASRADKIGPGRDVLHNTVLPTTWGGRPVWLHRKGAAPAALGEPTIVLGSRGAPSVVMLGGGDASALWSVAHGAGRKIGRSEAAGKMRAKHGRVGLGRTARGGHVLCDDPTLLLEEHPDVYKPVEPVVESLVRAGVARRVASLIPVINVKR
jgi:release factor H-coupled RctB family protein